MNVKLTSFSDVYPNIFVGGLYKSIIFVQEKIRDFKERFLQVIYKILSVAQLLEFATPDTKTKFQLQRTSIDFCQYYCYV